MQIKSLLNILLTVLLIAGASVQVPAQRRSVCPDYMWLVTYLPVTYLAFEKAPAGLSYTSDGNDEIDGKFPLTLGFRNLSDKTIKTLKVDWYLFDKYAWQNTQAQDRASFLEKITRVRGRLSIDAPADARPKEKFDTEVKLPCGQFQDQVSRTEFDQLWRKKNEMYMEFVVTEISYDDGSGCKRAGDQ